MTPDEQSDAEDDEADDDVIETAKLLLQVLPVIAEDHPRPNEEHHPRYGPDDREEEESPEGHPRDARRHRDERAHDREHPRKEDGEVTPAAEPPVRRLEIVRADQHVTSIPLEERTTAERPDRIADEGACGVSDHPGDHRAPIRPLRAGQRLDDPSRYAPSGERENQLRRDGDSGTLDGHGDHDADISETTVQGVDERKDELVDGLDQVSVS